MQELHKLTIQEPNNTIFFQFSAQLNTLLNSLPLKNIKAKLLIPIIVLQSERKRRQAVENLLKQIQKNPAYPDEVKSDIAKAHQETIKEYRKQIESLRETQNQATSKSG